VLATMMRDLLARSRAGKAGSCVPIPQAREIFFFHHTIFALIICSSSPLQCSHCSIYLSTSQDLAKVSSLSLSESLLSPSPQAFRFAFSFHSVSIFFPAPQDVPTSSGGPRMHRQGAKTRGDQGARCILLPVPCGGQRQWQELAVPPLPRCCAVRGRTFAAA
jgi:hypothetical protein